MAATNYRILVHSELHAALRKRSVGERTRFRKTVDRLRMGEWKGGTRVKRLQGVARPVYEARLDGGDRLLFTAGRSASRTDHHSLGIHLLLWDWVKHDDADRYARRNRSPEAEFLELPVIEEAEIQGAPPRPDAAFSDLPETEREEPLLSFLAPSPDWDPPETEAVTGAERWFVMRQAALADDAEFQRLMDSGSSELELKLSAEQYDVLRAPGPILLAGSAGSGKTTVSIHRLAEAAAQPSRPSAIYLSYSPWLTEYAEALYSGLLASRGAETGVAKPKFVTMTNLYRELTPDLASKELVPLAAFENWFAKSGAKLDLGLVGEELRSILKGACLDTGKSMLDREAYIELGRKRAPLFADVRPELYRIAEKYQKWLVDQGRIDQLDLCRAALRVVRADPRKRYDIVVCDEVQDLTELEVAFVMNLSADSRLPQVFLGGDTQQIIHPSGFRWAEVKQAVQRLDRANRPMSPVVLRLRRNYRSVRPIVQLANAVLAFRRQIFGRTEEDEPEASPLSGPVPLLLRDDEEAVLAGIADFGPRCAVLTLDDAETERLRARLSTSRVFHVRDAKGLEFDAVVLWKSLGQERGLIDGYLRKDGRNLEREPRFRRFLQWMYVALTRPRRHLAIFEGEGADEFWTTPKFRSLLEVDSAQTLARTFRSTASPEAWRSEATYYEKRGRFRQAAECYRRGGDTTGEARSAALGAEAVLDFETALAHWRTVDSAEKLGHCLEQLRRFEEAEREYLRAGRKPEAELCRARHLEGKGRFSEAAPIFLSLGRREDALRCWRKAPAAPQLKQLELELALEQKDWPTAAVILEQTGRFDEAAKAYRKAGQKEKANRIEADAYAKAGQLDKAQAAYRRAGATLEAGLMRAKAHEAAGNHLAAAKAYQKLKRLEEAANQFRKADDPIQAAKLDIRRLKPTGNFLPTIKALYEAGTDDECEIWAAHASKIYEDRIKSGAARFTAAEDADYDGAVKYRNRLCARDAEWIGELSSAIRLWRHVGDESEAKRVEALLREQSATTPAAAEPKMTTTAAADGPAAAVSAPPPAAVPPNTKPTPPRAQTPSPKPSKVKLPPPRAAGDLSQKTIELLEQAAKDAMSRKDWEIAAERWNLAGRWEEEENCLLRAIDTKEKWIHSLEGQGDDLATARMAAERKLNKLRAHLAAGIAATSAERSSDTSK